VTPRLLTDFHSQHRRRYGYSHAEREVEIVTVRLRAAIPSPGMPALRMSFERNSGERKSGEGKPAEPPPRASALERAAVWFEGKRRSAAIYERSQLDPRRRYAGPAVVTEYSATTVVPPGMRFHPDQTGNLLIRCR